MCQWNRSSSIQTMAWRLSAPGPNLNHLLPIRNPRTTIRIFLNRTQTYFVQDIAFKYVVRNILAIFQPQCTDKFCLQWCIYVTYIFPSSCTQWSYMTSGLRTFNKWVLPTIQLRRNVIVVVLFFGNQMTTNICKCDDNTAIICANLCCNHSINILMKTKNIFPRNRNYDGILFGDTSPWIIFASCCRRPHWIWANSMCFTSCIFY